MIERDVMEYDVVIVGGGPAGLACAIRLKQIDAELNVCLLEKASEIGAHMLSGCVLEPGPLDELLPAWRAQKLSICVPATSDRFVYMTRKRSIRLPSPPQMNNHGNFIVSEGALIRWVGEQAEALGVDLFPGFSGAEALIGDDGKVFGVRAGDMGVEKDGTQGPNYAPGVDIHARCTVLAEGCRGSITKQLIKRYSLDAGKSPQTYAIGLKELWQLPEGRTRPGFIQHSTGWPLDSKTYGGSLLYHLDQDRLYIGFVVGLDYEDPGLSPFDAFQQFKHHPTIKPLLDGGEILTTGARTLVEGGYQSIPRLEMPGALLVGDTAGTLNVPKIKGVHTAMRSGMLAAQHIAENGTTDGFDARWHASDSARELQRVRNIRPGFKRGFWLGFANAAFETVTFGKAPWTIDNHADHSVLKKSAGYVAPDRKWQPTDLAPRDRVASVYFAGNAHDENQPVHLKVADTGICATTCAEEFGNPCTLFCPANVYEMVDDEQGGRRLHINASNCVHCKACDIKDPYEIINWTTPEGGSGPNYQNM